MADQPTKATAPAAASKADAGQPSGSGSVSTSALAAQTPDDRDTTERRDTQDASGKRFRAIPTHGGTTVSVSEADFAALGIEGQGKVTWDFRNAGLTVPVGDGEGEISQEAAEALHKHEPTRFEFIDG